MNQAEIDEQLENLDQFRGRCVAVPLQIHFNGGRPVARFIDGLGMEASAHRSKLEEALHGIRGASGTRPSPAQVQRFLAEWLQQVADSAGPLVFGDLPDRRILVAWVPARHRGVLPAGFDPVRELHRSLVHQDVQRGRDVSDAALAPHI
jgi:hypothetical protein